MPDGKHYYSYKGPDFEGLRVLGLCCVPKPKQHWQPQAIRQHLVIKGATDPNIIARRYGDSGSTARWTFGYTLALPSIDRLFVEVDTGTAGAQDIAAVDAQVIRFLSERLRPTWGQLHRVSGPSWRPAPASAADWPPAIDVLKPLTAAPAPQPSKPVKSGGGGSIGTLVLVLVAVISIVLFARESFPVITAGSDAGTGVLSGDTVSGGAQPNQAPPAAPLAASTTFPANATLCRGGCPQKPEVGCPAPIKGRLMPDGQHWYYEQHHPRYNEFEPNPYVGEMWFCVVSEANDAGFSPAPFY